MKKIVLSLLTVTALFLSACAQEEKITTNPKETPAENQTSSQSSSFDIFGKSEFDTVVTGYLKILDEESYNEEIKNAYFVITDFQDDQFRKSIEIAIAEDNTVNKKEGENYLFRLGCFENNTIKGTNLDKETEQALIKSSKDNPLKVELSFKIHDEGKECICCNLASTIQLIK